MDFNHKKVLVFGTGMSGISATNLLEDAGAEVILFEGDPKATPEGIRAKLPQESKAGILFHEIPEDCMSNLDLVVLSPGVPIDIDMVNDLRKKQIPIWGEIELAYRMEKGSVVAITGTNGKTTTTSLVGEIMKQHFKDVFVVGNIGIPYTQSVMKTNSDSVTVAEISSFQLETVHEFQPKVSAILNITPDHLNRHHTMDNYINAKMQIAVRQTSDQICVLNYEDSVLRELASSLNAEVVFFSSKTVLEKGIYLDQNKDIILHLGNEKTVLCNIEELQLLGTHSYENVMAAVAIAISMKVPIEDIKKAVINFKAVEHRFEYVTEKEGVKYYNDSKGTNPDAAIKAVQAMVRPTVLIGGGYDKNSEYEEWIRAFDGKVKKLVLIGETKEKIAKAARSCGFEQIEFAESLEEAVDIGRKSTKPGDAVLLSPACASWGMFKNFEERGRMFKEYVNGL